MNLGEMIDKELREMREEMESLRRRVRELEGSSAAPLAYTVEGAAEALSTNASNVINSFFAFFIVFSPVYLNVFNVIH